MGHHVVKSHTSVDRYQLNNNDFSFDNFHSGLFISAVHNAGLSTLTSTPMNCGPALRTLLDRPKNEKLLFLLPVGHAAEEAKVPHIERKGIDDGLMVMVD